VVGPVRRADHPSHSTVVTYIVRRVFAAIVLLFIVSVITFGIFFLVPKWAGATPDNMASRYVGKAATAQVVHQRAEQLGFTDPIYVQYGDWAKGLVVGRDYNMGAETVHCPAPCLGYSFITNQPVFNDIVDRFPVTFSLALGAAFIWVTMGIAIGILSALKPGSVFDRFAMTIALAGVSLPIFWTALVGLAFFSYRWQITAVGGAYTPFTQNPAMWAYDLMLPWVTLALLFSAQYARLTRAGMLETMNEDYIRTARAKGLRERRVIVKHGLRGALTPLLTIFGLDFGLLIGGAVLTESAFGLNGLGKYAVDGIRSSDLPKVLGVTLVAALFVVIANLVVDLLYAVVDPRVRTR